MSTKGQLVNCVHHTCGFIHPLGGGLLLKTQPCPWKLWSLKNLDPEKPGPHKTCELGGCRKTLEGHTVWYY